MNVELLGVLFCSSHVLCVCSPIVPELGAEEEDEHNAMTIKKILAAGVLTTSPSPVLNQQPSRPKIDFMLKWCVRPDKYEDMVRWMKTLEDFSADPEALRSRRLEEEAQRVEAEQAEEHEKVPAVGRCHPTTKLSAHLRPNGPCVLSPLVPLQAMLEAAELKRQEEIEQKKIELEDAAAAEDRARERAAYNREQAQELVRAHAAW
eukprot:SAG11_NODE_784_length_7187_cov_2.920429_2_plen_205_part_00